MHRGALGPTAPGAAPWQVGHPRTISVPLVESGIYRPKSMLSMSAAELERLSGIDLLIDATHLPTDSLLQNTLTIQSPGTAPPESALRPVPSQQVEKRVERGLLDAPLDSSSLGELPAPLEPGSPPSTEFEELRALLERDLAALDQARITRTLTKESDRVDSWPASEKPEGPEPQYEAQPMTDTNPATEGTQATQPSDTGRLELPPLDAAQQRMVRNMLGEHATFESLASAKVSEFRTAGDDLLKQGKYYKAIDAYVLALIWDSNNPQLNLRRAIAHFGAGEFVSAALFLERAIVLEPSCLNEKIELETMLPSRDVIDNRLIEGADWQQQSASGEIAMLLAWVYQLQGQTTRAADYVRLAKGRIPDNPALATIAQAFNDR